MREEFPLFRVTHTLANTIKLRKPTKKIFIKIKRLMSEDVELFLFTKLIRLIKILHQLALLPVAILESDLIDFLYSKLLFKHFSLLTHLE